MKDLRKLGAAVILTCVLGLTTFAGQTMTPCPPPEPGQTMTPCDPGGSGVTGDMETPTASSTIPGDATVAYSETSFGEIAANALLTFLPLF
jgi:hypothetical protein